MRAGLALAAWGCALALGFHYALVYQATPGAIVEARASWPIELPVPLDPERPTLVLTLHPHCPCSRSTVEELDRLLAHTDSPPRTHVFFYSDPALGPHWHETDLWRRTSAIPGVQVHMDERGRHAASLGANVSGTAFLYSTEGVLLFEGGITAGRGHEGPNDGTSAIASILGSELPATRSTPAYGCGIVPVEAAPTALP